MACPSSSPPPPSLPEDLSQCQPTSSGDVDRTGDDDISSPAASEFNFCVCAETQHHISSTADELFSNGRLLPLSFPPAPRPVLSTRPSPSPPPPSLPPVAPALRLKEVMEAPHEEEEEGNDEAKRPSPFWRFGRSVSLNSGGRQKGGGLIQILSRSKSTGSNLNPNPKLQRQSSARSSSCKSNSTNKFLRRTSSLTSSSSSSSSSSSYYYSSCDNCRSGGVRISPVLNVPPPYLLPKGSGGGLGFSGFGILLCIGKEKVEEDRSSRKKPMFSF